MNQSLATIVSRIFDPFVSLTAVFILLFYGSPKFIPAFLLMIILPLVFFIVAWKTKYISNWDVSVRRERPKILWPLLGIEIVASGLLKTTVLFPVLLALAGFAVVTQFWKISGHTMAIAYATGLAVKLFGWQWWPVLFIVPLVGWARVVRHDHTILQVAAGAVYSWSLLVIARPF